MISQITFDKQQKHTKVCYTYSKRLTVHNGKLMTHNKMNYWRTERTADDSRKPLDVKLTA
jgi:hypothetical protein